MKKIEKEARFYQFIILSKVLAEITMLIGAFIILYVLVMRYA